jgi:Tfp pilus assembly protein PilV
VKQNRDRQKRSQRKSVSSFGCGFSYLETLISVSLLMVIVLLMGAMNMTSLNLLGSGKTNQKATLLLLDKLEELRSLPIQDLADGIFDQTSGNFLVRWQIETNVPYLGTKKIHCRVIYQPAASVIVESILYRAE